MYKLAKPEKCPTPKNVKANQRNVKKLCNK